MEITLFLEILARNMLRPIRPNGRFMGRDEGSCDKDTFDLTQRYLKSLFQYLRNDINVFHLYVYSIYNLILFKETCVEFLEASPKSMYNCYKLLGFDVLVDNNLKVIQTIWYNDIFPLLYCIPNWVRYQPLIINCFEIIGAFNGG